MVAEKGMCYRHHAAGWCLWLTPLATLCYSVLQCNTTPWRGVCVRYAVWCALGPRVWVCMTCRPYSGLCNA